MSRRILSAGLTLVCMLAAAGPARAQTTLRYKYKEGDSIPYKIDQDMKMAMSVAGMDIDVTMKMTMDLTWKIKKVTDDGKAEIGFKFGATKIVMDMPPPVGKVEVASTDENEPDDAMGQMMSKMVKGLAKLEMTGMQTDTGELSDIKIPDAALKELKKLAAGAGPAAGMFNADSLKNMVGGSNGLVLPKDAVSKGKSWNHKSTSKTEFGDANVDVKYTYQGNKDGLENISLKPIIDIKPKDKSPIPLKVKSADGKGTALFDNQAGQLREMNMTQVIEMEAEVMGQTISQKMTIETKMKQGKSKKSSE
jgi:hypothetical protein